MIIVRKKTIDIESYVVNDTRLTLMDLGLLLKLISKGNITTDSSIDKGLQFKIKLDLEESPEEINQSLARLENCKYISISNE